jgi:hypothetical protein
LVVHGHHGDHAKRGLSVMSDDVFGRVLREVIARGSTGAGRVVSRCRIYRQHIPSPRERTQRRRDDSEWGWNDQGTKLISPPAPALPSRWRGRKAVPVRRSA